MKSKILQGIIKDLMRVPMEHGMNHDGMEHEPPKGVHVTIMEAGKPGTKMMPDEDESADPIHDDMKEAMMNKAMHAKGKKHF